MLHYQSPINAINLKCNQKEMIGLNHNNSAIEQLKNKNLHQMLEVWLICSDSDMQGAQWIWKKIKPIFINLVLCTFFPSFKLLNYFVKLLTFIGKDCQCCRESINPGEKRINDPSMKLNCFCARKVCQLPSNHRYIYWQRYNFCA